jgi:hypothetical protein
VSFSTRRVALRGTPTYRTSTLPTTNTAPLYDAIPATTRSDRHNQCARKPATTVAQSPKFVTPEPTRLSRCAVQSKHRGSHQVRQRSTRGNKSRVKVAGPRNGRQHTRFCAREQSRRSMTCRTLAMISARRLIAQTVTTSSFACAGLTSAAIFSFSCNSLSLLAQDDIS